jgi:GH18 family chitinase
MAKYVDYFIYMTYDLHGQWGMFDLTENQLNV